MHGARIATGFILAKTARKWPIRLDFTPRAAHHHRRQIFYLDSRALDLDVADNPCQTIWDS